MTIKPPQMPWQCFWFMWHKWRYYGWIGADVCVREGCGEVRRPPKPGTKAETR